jgi:hypothetical protein
MKMRSLWSICVSLLPSFVLYIPIYGQVTIKAVYLELLYGTGKVGLNNDGRMYLLQLPNVLATVTFISIIFNNFHAYIIYDLLDLSNHLGTFYITRILLIMTLVGALAASRVILSLR